MNSKIQELSNECYKSVETIYLEYNSQIRKMAHGIARSKEDAEDLEQNFWIRVCRGAKERRFTNFTSWASRALRDIYIKSVSKEISCVDYPDGPQFTSYLSVDLQVSHHVERILEEIDKLPHPLSGMVIMVCAGFSVKEAAEEYGVDSSKAKDLICRAKKKIRKNIRAEVELEDSE